MQAEERKRPLAGRRKIPPAAFLHRLPIRVKRETYLANMPQAVLQREANDDSRTTNEGAGLLRILRAILTTDKARELIASYDATIEFFRSLRRGTDY